MENDKSDNKKPNIINRQIVLIVAAISFIAAAMMLLHIYTYRLSARRFCEKYAIEESPDTDRNTVLIPLEDNKNDVYGNTGMKRYLKVKIVKEIVKDPEITNVFYKKNKVKVKLTRSNATFYDDNGFMSKVTEPIVMGPPRSFNDGKIIAILHNTLRTIGISLVPNREIPPDDEYVYFDNEGNRLGTFIRPGGWDMMFSDDGKKIALYGRGFRRETGFVLKNATKFEPELYKNISLIDGTFMPDNKFIGIFNDALRYSDESGNILYVTKNVPMSFGAIIPHNNIVYILATSAPRNSPITCNLYSFDPLRQEFQNHSNPSSCSTSGYSISLGGNYITIYTEWSISVYDIKANKIIYDYFDKYNKGKLLVDSALYDENTKSIVILGYDKTVQSEVIQILNERGTQIYETQIGKFDPRYIEMNFHRNIRYSDDGRYIIADGHRRVVAISLKEITK